MQVAIVTGGSSGIGQSAAVQIAARGTGVILTYRSNRRRALDTVAAHREGRRHGRRAAAGRRPHRHLPGVPRGGRRGAARHVAA